MSGLRFMIIAFCLLLGLAALAGEPAPLKARDICPIKVGQSVPDVLLENLKGDQVSLTEVITSQPTILIFYRGSWCPYCNRHLGELQTIEAELKAMGYQVVAVSPDLPENLQKMVEKQSLNYTLLSDSSAKASRALGLAFKVDDQTYEQYMGYGIDLEKAAGQDHHLLPAPAAFVLDMQGRVRFSFVSPDYKVRVNPAVLMAAAKTALK